MKTEAILGGLGFWGLLFAFGYFSDKEEANVAIFAIWIAFGVYWLLKRNKDPRFWDKLPPLLEGLWVGWCLISVIAAFALLMLFFLTRH